MKKAISPLIATVLLIGFTVALAAVIMTWGGGFTKKLTGETEITTEQSLACTKIDFEITNVDCLLNQVTITNNGPEIKSMKFRIDNPLSFDMEDYSTLIGDFEIKTIPLTQLTVDTTKIEAIPILASSSGNKDFACIESSQESIDPCAT